MKQFVLILQKETKRGAQSQVFKPLWSVTVMYAVRIKEESNCVKQYAVCHSEITCNFSSPVRSTGRAITLRTTSALPNAKVLR